MCMSIYIYRQNLMLGILGMNVDLMRTPPLPCFCRGLFLPPCGGTSRLKPGSMDCDDVI